MEFEINLLDLPDNQDQLNTITMLDTMEEGMPAEGAVDLQAPPDVPHLLGSGRKLGLERNGPGQDDRFDSSAMFASNRNPIKVDSALADGIGDGVDEQPQIINDNDNTELHDEQVDVQREEAAEKAGIRQRPRLELELDSIGEQLPETQLDVEEHEVPITRSGQEVAEAPTDKQTCDPDL